jgi:hypothetical protein
MRGTQTSVRSSNPGKLLSLKNFSLDRPRYLTYDTAASGGAKWSSVNQSGMTSTSSEEVQRRVVQSNAARQL